MLNLRDNSSAKKLRIYPLKCKITVQYRNSTSRFKLIVIARLPLYLYSIKSTKNITMETYTFTQNEKLEQAKSRVKCIKGFYTHATVYLFVNLFIIASCYIDNPQSLNTSDPYMTALFWGIGLLAHGFSVFGHDFIFGKNWQEREIQKILNN